MLKIRAKKLQTSAGFMGLLFLTGCINLTPDLVMPVGQIGTIDSSLIADPSAPAKSTIKTAQSGEVLYSRPVKHAFELVLENAPAADGKIGNSVQDRKLELKSGQKYFPVVTFGEAPSISACSFDRPLLAIPRLAPGNQGYIKLCFKITDLPEDFKPSTLAFDNIDWVSSEFYAVVEPIGATGRSSYQSLSRWDPHVSSRTVEPARFRKQAATPVSGREARQSAVRFVMSPTGPQLETAYMAGDEPRKTQKEPVAIDTAKPFPQTVELAGGTIELLALTDGVLAYRIVSAESQDRQIVMDLN